MLKFETSSGSIYEVDSSLCQIRRVNDPRPPTSRIGAEWVQYSRMSELKEGMRAYILFGEDDLVTTTVIVKIYGN